MPDTTAIRGSRNGSGDRLIDERARRTTTPAPLRLIDTTFSALARVRRARVFHPRGVYVAGELEALANFERILGPGRHRVVARLSKASSTPGGLPDVFGLALRVLDADDQPWDIALATTGTGPLTRFVLTPTSGWARARYGSLMAYRIENGELRWLFAIPDEPQPAGASLDAMAEHVRTRPLRFTLALHPLTRPGPDVARVELSDPAIDTVPEFFDPTIHHPATVRLEPGWVTEVRRVAYQGSRRGRGVKNG